MITLLVETAAGYALLKLKKDSLVSATPSEVAEKFITSKGARKCISLEAFKRFDDVKQATQEVSALTEGKIGSLLKSFIKNNLIKTGLASQGAGIAVWDKTLAQAIKKKFNVEVLLSPAIHEIFRGVKSHIEELIKDLTPQENRIMSTSLSHSLNRFKLKFSAEKVDIMVIQAVGLLDDLDKELNNMAMRLKEWYGFHFPELLKLVSENWRFAKLVKKIGYRKNVQKIEDFEGLLAEDVEAQVRQAAETSMGSDIVDSDLESIYALADIVLELTTYRESLTDYLKLRMDALAPNLTHIVGEVLAARLVAQAGSLMDLAKHASSTVQILGAEKALFRAIKTKSNTPKYGLIYHAHLVGQASPKLKGKVSRILAAKLSLCTRVDALTECSLPTVAVGAKAYVERRLEELTEGGANVGNAGRTSTAQMSKYIPSRLREPTRYDPSNDQIMPTKPEVKQEIESVAPPAPEPEAKESSSKTRESKKHRHKDKSSSSKRRKIE